MRRALRALAVRRKHVAERGQSDGNRGCDTRRLAKPLASRELFEPHLRPQNEYPRPMEEEDWAVRFMMGILQNRD